MNWLKCLLCSVVALSVILCADARRKRRKYVFQVQSPDGPQKIKSLAEAKRLCRQAGGASIAKSWQVRDAVRFRQFGDTQCGCGWAAKSRNVRPRCGNDPMDQFYFRCKQNPADDGKEGYDAYCFGFGPPAIPPDAVPINYGDDRGYVFLQRDGEDAVIPSESKARAVCGGRQAKLASVAQVRQAWFNGFSQCECAWMEGYQSRVMNDVLKSCGLSLRIQGCHHGALRHSLCFIKADMKPLTHGNQPDFDNLARDVVPVSLEVGATKVTGGYVYPTMSTLGDGRTPNLFWAHKTCKEQGARVATPEQLSQAISNGFTWCQCGYVWKNAQILYGVMVKGDGAVMYAAGSDQCGPLRGLVDCALPTSPGQGYDVFCYKECPNHCPSAKTWKVPPGSVPVKGGRVYHVEHRDGKYKLGSESEAARECQRQYNGQLATKAQLQEAQYNGMTKCRCGWTQGESSTPFIGYPMFRPIESCGGTTGVLPCPANFPDIPQSGPWDAYCYVSDAKLA